MKNITNDSGLFRDVIGGHFDERPWAKGACGLENSIRNSKTNLVSVPICTFTLVRYWTRNTVSTKLSFGFRAELYLEGFTKEVNDWSVAHGVTATGHQDQEEVVNQVSISGDYLKSFKYLEFLGLIKSEETGRLKNFTNC